MAAVSLVLAVVSTTAAGWAVIENRSLRAQLEERQLLPPRRGTDYLTLDGDASQPLPAPAAVATRLREMEKRLTEASERIETQNEQHHAAMAGLSDELQTTARRVEEAMVDAGGQPGVVVPAPGVSAPDDDRIKKMIESKVEEEVKKQQSKDQKKPPLSQVAATLGLSEYQREQMRREVVRAQEEMIEVLSIPTSDGTVLIDELLSMYSGKEASTPEEAQARMLKIFGRLSSEKVPGSEETYVKRMESVNRRVTDAFRRDLTPEQWTEYEKMGIPDPTEIQVKGSPWEKAFQEFLKRQQKK